MKRTKLFLFFLLFIISTNLRATDKSPEEYKTAINSYNQKKYNAARKQFSRVIKKYPEWTSSSRIYIARCWSKTGKHKKSIEELELLLEEAPGDELVVVRELGKLGSMESLDKLKELIKTSKVKEIREKAAALIGKVSRKIDPGEINRHIDFMIEVLKIEPEMEVAKEISCSIYRMGKVNADKLIKIYKRADKFLKKKLLFLISKYDDEDLIMTLQEESEKPVCVIKNYILWALAKMDPYRFAKLYKGKLKKKEDSYILYGEDFKIELFKPSLKREKVDEFESLIGKSVTIYGVEVEDGVIYTDFFKSK